jgi:peptidoglycan/LPS O-acetylase OafA/YrhL
MLARDPAATTRSTQLDALRGVAALTVLIFHSQGLATGSPALGYWVISHFDFGLSIFFTLSGFLLGGPFIRALREGKPPPRTGGYLLRRSARILPAYWAVLLFFLAAGGAAGLLSAGDWLRFGAHVVLAQNEVPGEASRILWVGWTLGIEATFYLALPAAAGLARRAAHGRPLPRRTIIIALGSLWAVSAAWALTAPALLGVPAGGRSVWSGWGAVAVVTLPGMLYQFMPGLLLAAAGDGVPRRRWMVAGVVLWAATTWGRLALPDTLPYQWAGDQLDAPAAGMILAGAVALRARVGIRLLAVVGVVSYGTYLWHFPISRAIQEVAGGPLFSGPAATPLAAAALLAVTLPFAILSWFLLERPAIAGARRLLARRRGRPGGRARSAVALTSGAAHGVLSEPLPAVEAD